MRFQLGDVARNRRSRQSQPLGGARETSLLDHLGEDRQREKAIHEIIPIYLQQYLCFMSLVYPVTDK